MGSSECNSAKGKQDDKLISPIFVFPRELGTPRRKVKKVTKTNSGDDRKLQAALQSLKVQPIPGIEEVNMFRDDGKVIHLSHPRIQAAANANTFAIHGRAVEKDLTELGNVKPKKGNHPDLC